MKGMTDHKDSARPCLECEPISNKIIASLLRKLRNYFVQPNIFICLKGHCIEFGVL